MKSDRPTGCLPQLEERPTRWSAAGSHPSGGPSPSFTLGEGPCVSPKLAPTRQVVLPPLCVQRSYSTRPVGLADGLQPSRPSHAEVDRNPVTHGMGSSGPLEGGCVRVGFKGLRVLGCFRV